MGRAKLGIQPDTEDAIRGAIAKMARDRSLPRTAGKLAKLAGVGRATIYRAFKRQTRAARLVPQARRTITRKGALQARTRPRRTPGRDPTTQGTH